ncbi:helix-turn-helix domain-containing protein [Arthrobacter glacialis]|uniref:helix-turn-helix domain-containing protein n=1 Tax=Arthrobacter glacialis TaxID=1664 RepID=UPI0013FDFFEB
MSDQPADSTTAHAFPEEWLSPTEICRELQIPLPTFYQWRSRGIGPHAYKIGRHVRVSRTDLDAWISLQSET